MKIFEIIEENSQAALKQANNFLPELFDPKEASPLEWDETNPYAVYASGHVPVGGHDVAIDITFSMEDEGVVNIEFMVGGEFALTGKGGANQVFATVIEAVKKFVKQRPRTVRVITFTAEERSRARMYDTITKRVAQQLGWHVIPYEEVARDPRFRTAMSYGAFLFVIEKGQAPEHRAASQKPQHGKFATVFYVYSREEDLPVYKVQAKRASEAENYVMRTVPEYQKTNPMGVFAGTVPIDGAIDLGEAPPPKPKPAPRILSPLEQKLHDKINAVAEVQFGGQDVEGNALITLKEKFPNLSTIAYFIPGFGQALLAADLASQVQMYNQAMAKIEQKFPAQTIQTVQQKVGDTGDWEEL